jgi:SnoaL-like domain
MSEAESLTQLLDLEELRKLKARYFRLLDAQDWDGFRTLFTDDAHFELQGAEPIDGADAFVAFTSKQLKGARTVHHGHQPELTIDSPTEAHGCWVLADYVEWPSASGTRRGIKGYGRYDETYRKRDGVWRIASWRLTYARMDPLPREPLPDEILGGPDLLREGEYADNLTPGPA